MWLGTWRGSYFWIKVHIKYVNIFYPSLSSTYIGLFSGYGKYHHVAYNIICKIHIKYNNLYERNKKIYYICG